MIEGDARRRGTDLTTRPLTYSLCDLVPAPTLSRRDVIRTPELLEAANPTHTRVVRSPTPYDKGWKKREVEETLIDPILKGTYTRDCIG